MESKRKIKNHVPSGHNVMSLQLPLSRHGLLNFRFHFRTKSIKKWEIKEENKKAENRKKAAEKENKKGRKKESKRG